MKTQKVFSINHSYQLIRVFSIAFFFLFLITTVIAQKEITNEITGSKVKDKRVQTLSDLNNSQVSDLQINKSNYVEDQLTELNSDPVLPSDAPLAARTASNSGNWNSTTTWGGAAVPTSSDAVTINSGITVTVNIANAQCASLTFAAVNNNSTLTISGTNSLAITGLLSMPRPASGKICTVNVNAGTLSCGSLTMGATTTTRNDIINISTGTLTIAGTLTTGTTGCQIIFSDEGTLNMGGTMSNSPTITTVTGSTVNYTGSSAQTIYPITYNGNLGCSGAGTKTIASTKSVTVKENFINSSTFVVTDGTTTTDTWFSVGGNFTNSGTFTETGVNSRFMLNGTSAQTLTNTGTITSSLSEFGLANAAGVTISSNSNQIVVARADLFYGYVTNSNKLTFGTGGTSASTIQRGVSSNTDAAGGFDQSPVFNLGSGGLYLLYDNGVTAYNTGFEVPSTLSVDALYIFDAADITLNSNVTITDELNFYGGTGTPILRIGANTLTLGGSVTYTVPGSFYGGTTSNLVMNGATTLNSITNGLNDLTINGNTSLGGAVTVNGTLFLTNGLLINGSNLTMANGATISRSGGNLNSSPNFTGTVNLIYDGTTPLNTGKEIPSGSSVLNNLTVNSGGITQYDFSSSTNNLLNDAFPNLTSWTGNKGTSAGQFNSVSTTTAGGTSPEATFIGSSSHGNSTYYIYRGPVNTAGYTSVNISFKTATSTYYTPTATTYLKLQTATSAAGPWHDAWSHQFTAQLNAQTITIPNYSTNVGGNMYFQFAYVGDFYAVDNWWFDDLKVDAVIITPIASTVNVNGNLDLSSGTYTIGTGNTLAINGSISGSNELISSVTSNISVGGTGLNLTLPTIINDLNNLTITRPNGVSIASDKTLTVTGTLSNSAGTSGLIIRSDASSTGSLIHTSNNIPATVERFIADDWKWHFLSSPVASQSIWPSFAPDPGAGLNFGSTWNWDFYYWNPNANTSNSLYWVNLRKENGDYNDGTIDQTGSNAGFGTATPALVPGRGYLVAYNTGWNPATSSPTTHTFTGNLNTGNINKAVLLGENSFNLVGNPYASSIDWKSSNWGTGRNALVNNAGGFDYWIWNEANGNYGVFNSAGADNSGTLGVTRNIAPQQGFFVQASADGNLAMNNSIRNHSTQSWFKGEEAENSVLRLELSTPNNSYHDEMVVEFNPSFTGGGSSKFWSFYTEAPEIYTVKDGTYYSIDRYSDLTRNTIVQLGTKTESGVDYVINASNISDFDLTNKVYLEDLTTGSLTNLKTTSSYSFKGDAGHNTERFRLIFEASTGINPLDASNFNVYSSGKTVYILNNGVKNEFSTEIINISGQVVSFKESKQDELTKIELNAAPGVYIVRIISSGKVTSVKVVLQ